MSDKENRPGNTRSKLRDVAASAGVSASTVSLVLAGKGDAHRIAEETRQRVLEAAARLDYAPSLLHRSVRRGRTGIVSFYSSFRNREAGDLYMDRVSAAVEHAAARRHRHVLVHGHFDQSPRETYEFLTGGFADGILMFGAQVGDPLLAMLRRSHFPVVVVNPSEPERVLSSVDIDEKPGLIALADTLAEQGHARVAGLLVDWPGFLHPNRRYETILSRLRERGTDAPDLRVVVQGGDHRAALQRTLDLPERPTALFAWHDRLAYNLLEACGELGVDVPSELSIVGFDGLVWPAATPHIVPSVGVPIETVADRAVATLIRLIEGETGPFYESVPGLMLSGTSLGPASTERRL